MKYVIRRVGGGGDFIGSDEVCTRYYEYFCYFDQEHVFTTDESKAKKYSKGEDAEQECPSGCQVVKWY